MHPRGDRDQGLHIDRAAPDDHPVAMRHREVGGASADLLTLDQVAVLLHTTPKQVRNMKSRAQLPPAVDVPGLTLRWRAAEIHAFIARRDGAATGPRLLSVAQVAERLGMSPAAIYQLGDRLPGRVKVGTRVRYQEAAIAAIVERGL